MKKIFRLTLLLLSVAAFVATLASPTKAATSPEISFVTVGNRVYVHIADYMDGTNPNAINIDLFIDRQAEESFMIEFDTPKAVYFVATTGSNAFGSGIDEYLQETTNYISIVSTPNGDDVNVEIDSDNFGFYPYYYQGNYANNYSSALEIYYEIESELDPVQIQPSVYHMTAAVFGNAVNVNENFILEKIGNSVQLKALNNTYNTEVNGINYINLHSMLNNGIHGVNISFGNDTRSYQLTVYERAFGFTPVTRITHSIQSINPSLSITDTGSSTRSVEIFDNNTSVAVYPALNYSQSTAMYAFVFLDEMAPIINGQTATVTNVDSPLTETQIRSYLAAWDDTDGDLTSQIVVVEDNYTPNRFTIGTWTITYSVTDSSDNESTLVMSVVVSDVVKPTLVSAQNTYTIGYKQTFDVEQLRAQIQASSFDNYDDTVTVVIDSNTYTTNKTVIGTYSVVYSATDSSGNKQTKTIQIAVIDNVAPVINGPSTIAKPKNSVLTESQIRAQLSAYDEISGTLTGSITLVSNDYTGKGSIIGTYLIVYSVSDTAGNVATKQVEVRVIDNLAPFWFIRDNAMIAVENTVTLTREQIVAILTQTGQLTITATTYVSFLQDEYQGNESIPGMYALTIRTTSNSGDENLYNIIVSVYEASGDDSDIVIDTPPTWFEENGPWIALGIFVLAGIIVFAAVITKFGKRKSYRRKSFR